MAFARRVSWRRPPRSQKAWRMHQLAGDELMPKALTNLRGRVPRDVTRVPHARFCGPRSIFRVSVWIDLIRDPMVDAEHPFDAAHDATYHSAYHGPNRTSSLVAHRHAVSDSSRNPLSIGGCRE